MLILINILVMNLSNTVEELESSTKEEKTGGGGGGLESEFSVHLWSEALA